VQSFARYKGGEVSLADICCNLAGQLGLLAGKGRNVLSSTRERLKESTDALNPKKLPEKIRNAIFEKLTRTLYKQAEFMMGKISERMEVIDEVARPFYEKISELAAYGPVTEGQLWQVMNSIEAADKLSEEEKTLLISIFGQIFGAQKSKYVDATVVEKNNTAKTKSKPQLGTGKSR
jgi:cell division protein ZapA (FtsZ GTPase activity inhibitor)